MYEDKTLVCKECGQEFVFTAGEQEFYAERGFQNEPQRCKACREQTKIDISFFSFKKYWVVFRWFMGLVYHSSIQIGIELFPKSWKNRAETRREPP